MLVVGNVMPIDVAPTLPVALSLASCAFLPLALLALSHGSLKMNAPGKRFVAAAAMAWMTWAVAMLAVSPVWVDLVTGALLLATASLAGFTLWTLIAWGLTLSMLLALARAGRPLSIEKWAWNTRQAVDEFARDRSECCSRWTG